MKIIASKFRSLVLAAAVACALGSNDLRAVGPVVNLSLSQSSVASDFSGTVSLTITGLPTTGQSVLVEEFTDLNGNGVIDPGDILVRSFTVTDGQLPLIGGVRNINQPGDEDGAADGSIRVDLALPGLDNTFSLLTGNYIFRVSDPLAVFSSAPKPFAVTAASYAQGVQGTITEPDGTTPVAGAFVVLLSGNNGNGIGGTFTDLSGNYQIGAALPGDYQVFVIAPASLNLVCDTSLASTTVGSGVFSVLNETLVAATSTISGQVTDSGSANGVAGIFIVAQSSNNYLTGAFTDSSGNYTMAANADQWQFDMTDGQLAQKGYVRPQSKSAADTTGGDAVVNITLHPATALIYGTVTDGSSNPLNGFQVGANDDTSTYEAFGLSFAPGGNYCLGVVAGTWSDGLSPDSLPAGYFASPSVQVTVTAGQAIEQDLVAHTVTAHLQGTVSKSGTPLAGVQVNVFQTVGDSNGPTTSTTTDGSGNFDLGVFAGTWTVVLDSNSAGSNSVVSPLLSYTVADSDTVTGIALNVLPSTGTISGTVYDSLGDPVSNASVNAGIGISAVNYAAGAQTDGSGHYSFPVVNGTWNVGASASGLSYNNQAVSVSGSATADFHPSVISSQPANQTVSNGGQVSFSIGTNTPGANTVQWQVSTNNGSTWSNLGESAPNSGTTTASLTINPVTLAMNGNQYRCVVTYNAGANSENSNAAVLTVNGVAPTFTQQPSAQTVQTGHGTSFTAQVSDGAATFQWQISTDGGTVWNNVTDNSTYGGSTTATLAITNPPLTSNGDQFRVVATDGLGSTSDAVVLTVLYPVPDFNGDGQADILWTNTSTGDRAVWFMNGTNIGSFGYIAGIPVEWNIVGTGDFDGDGQTDILWEDTVTGDRSIWLMNGTTLLTYPYLAYVDPVWHIAAVGDFNGDGHPDVIWENTSTGDRAIWFLNGTGIDSFGYIAGIPTDWHIVGAADFDGDGQTDLVWENLVTGDRTVWYMTGNTLSTFGYIANIPAPWHIGMVADFDGDGHPDLLWENPTTGDRAIWLMNDTTQLSAPYLANVDPVWRIAP